MADIDIQLNGGAAKICKHCDNRINESKLKSQLLYLRDLDSTHFYVCSECVTIIDANCKRCGGAVYVPREYNGTPSICPACRNDIFESSGSDPGWNGEIDG